MTTFGLLAISVDGKISLTM